MTKQDSEVARVLPDAEMRALGFTDHREGYWYYVTRVGANTTLNISINKATGGYAEQVLEEFFGQYEMYGWMREPYRTTIRDNIDRELAQLNAAGLQVRVDHAEYGWSEGSRMPDIEEEIEDAILSAMEPGGDRWLAKKMAAALSPILNRVRAEGAVRTLRALSDKYAGFTSEDPLQRLQFASASAFMAAEAVAIEQNSEGNEA